ncbi:MAG: AraC family transcriptional regulator [Oscillospiraceae bacterium]|nr:AraC family transcriptional regulator [Oscillospiraceae bacterium]
MSTYHMFQKNIQKKDSTSNFHYPMEREFEFHNLISNGRLEEVEAALKKNDFLKVSENVILSENKVQNVRYHFIVSITLITRSCIQAGMPEIQAFRLNDAYIHQADQTHQARDILLLYNEACMEYTLKMKRLQKKDISSKHIFICINYIQQNIKRKLSIPEIANYLHLHPSYLSKLFQEQMGCSIHTYIIMQKIEEAKNLLKFTDYPCRAIASSLSFSSQSHFIQLFQKYTNITPKQYRNQQIRNNIINEKEDISILN